MEKKILLISLLSFMFVHHTLMSQEQSTNRAIVFTKSGIGMSGYLMEIRVGMEDDTVVIVSAQGTELVPVNDLSRVIILPREHEGNLFLAGAIVGTYVSTLLIGHTEELPTGYLEEPYAGGVGLLLTSALGILVGGGIGAFVNSGSSSEIVLEFNRSAGERKASRLKLYGIFASGTDYPKLHLSVQGGHVYARVKDDFLKYGGNNNYGMYGGGVSNFTMLRKIQLTYSIKRNIEIGAAVQWSSEPKVLQSTYSWNSNTNYSTSSSAAYEQIFTVTGYYAIGKYKPFVEELPAFLDVAFGGGIGIANIIYHRGVGLSSYTNTFDNGQYQTTSTVFNKDVNKSMGSAIMFGEVSYYVQDYFTIGVTADYSFFPSIIIPEEPAAGLLEQTLSGNACIGFVLGIHL